MAIYFTLLLLPLLARYHISFLFLFSHFQFLPTLHPLQAESQVTTAQDT